MFTYDLNCHLYLQKRNKDLEAEVLTWIFGVLGEPVPKGEFEDILKDGVVLCNLMNKLAPGSVKKIATKGTNFQLMENIQRFQAGMKAYGVPQEEIFQTADLFERRNVAQVNNADVNVVCVGMTSNVFRLFFPCMLSVV